MEYTVKTWQGYTYSLLKPGCAEGSEMRMHAFGLHSERSANKTPILCTDPYVYARRQERQPMNERTRRRWVAGKRSRLRVAGWRP